ncbi:MAG: DPP IV N-terminal domain-containing protein [Pseudoxanthomonas sp.]
MAGKFGYRARFGAVALMGLIASSALAQTGAMLTADDYDRAAKFIPQNATPLVDHAVEKVAWLDAGRFWYRDHDASGDRFLVFDVATGKAGPAFDHAALAKALTASGDKPAKAGKLPVTGIKPLDGGRVEIATASGAFVCNGKTCAAKPKPAKKQKPGVASPDGKQEAFIRDWNLWLRDLASGAETQLTRDGATDYGYATDNAGWQHSDKAVLLWSPDSTRIATFRQDQRKVGDMVLVKTNVGTPEVERWKYPMAGDEHPIMIERVVIDVAAKQVLRLKTPADFHRSTCSDDIVCDNGWEDVQWAKDGKTLAFVSTDRGHKSATLRVADAATGEVRDVYTETVATQYQSNTALSSVAWRYLPESGEFLWYSQKSDWGHLYLHDLATGKEKRQVTAGEWNVDGIARIDGKTRTLWFVGNGREPGNPYYKHLYKVSLDGGEPTLLTPETADHAVSMSEDGAWFVDAYSTTAQPTVTVLRSAIDGAVKHEIARADISRLQAIGWQPAEQITVKARDGKTDLYGLMVKPANLDPTKKYPVIVYIYPGPQVGSVSNYRFGTAFRDGQSLAQLGFVFIGIDGMGTPWRSKAFQDVPYGNMADNTLPDQVAAVKQLGERYPWFDTSRVGMWGHSGGGNATTTALFRYPETFKVGWAESGNHDNLGYEDDWAERYHGLLEKKEDGSGSNYTGQDNASMAKNLQGRLMLVHGTLDDNVPPYLSLLVADALIKANKDFDMLMIPNARHGYGMGATSQYVTRRRWDYFVQHLLGAAPPANYELKANAP